MSFFSKLVKAAVAYGIANPDDVIKAANKAKRFIKKSK